MGNKMMNLDKYKKEMEERKLREENVILPSFNTAEHRMMLGEKPKYKRTQEDLNLCQEYMAGAVQLMYNRLSGVTEFNISKHQYDQFLVDAKEQTKLYTWGFITLDEMAEWIFDAINVEMEE